MLCWTPDDFMSVHFFADTVSCRECMEFWADPDQKVVDWPAGFGRRLR